MKKGKLKSVDEKKLLKAALEEFGSNSFNEASVNRIIAASDISKGSFYWRFSTKKELYFHLLKIGVDKKWETINSFMKDQSSSISDDMFSQLEQQLLAAYSFSRQNPLYEALYKRFLNEKGTPLYNEAVEYLQNSDHESSSVPATSLKKWAASGEYPGIFRSDFIQTMLPFLMESFPELARQSGMEPEIFVSQFTLFLKRALAEQ